MARRLPLVEDSSLMRKMISALLRDDGYEVGPAVDGEDGLARAREFAPELIVTDCEMPVMDGPAFCQALKADPGDHAHDPRVDRTQGLWPERRGRRLHPKAVVAPGSPGNLRQDSRPSSHRRPEERSRRA